jgi:hypothetical protein
LAYAAAVIAIRILIGLCAAGLAGCASPRAGDPTKQPPGAVDAAVGTAPDPSPSPAADAAPAADVRPPGTTARCGNGVLEPGELCDGNCPTTCARTGCAQLILGGAAASCNAICVESGAVTACVSRDGCCPRECNGGNDGDCAQTCGPADGVCPSGCNPGQDADCKRPGGAACAASSECVSGYCIDGFCCTQGCGACQSCTGGGGTCVDIPRGRTDDFPANACSGEFLCDGSGNCRPRCNRPGDLMCSSPSGATGCGRSDWGFEEPAVPAGVSLEVETPSLAGTALLVTNARSNSGERSVTTTIPRDAVLGVGVNLCPDTFTQAPVRNRNASAYYYLDRFGPVGSLAYLRIKASGYDSTGNYNVLENRMSTPVIGRWTKISVNFQEAGFRGQRIAVDLYTGPDPDAETHLYVDDVRVE